MQNVQRLAAGTALVIAMIVGSVALAQNVRNVAVHFHKGDSGITIKDRIAGDESVRYTLRVNAGQKVSVQLDTDNSSNYFNVTAPSKEEALFVGSLSGNGTSFTTAESGDYVINVYLMRNAARRNEKANYSLTVYAEGGAQQKPVHEGRLPK